MSKNYRIEAWFDGACGPPNPGGHTGYGALVKVEGRVVLEEATYLGQGFDFSNNVAEYAGCLAALNMVARHPGVAVVYGDSKLVILQLLGSWSVKGGLYVPWYEKAAKAYARVRQRTALRWIPRHENHEADALSKRAVEVHYPHRAQEAVL